MKTYFLALRNEDFTITGKTWKSSSIDLYANRFYTNYSVLKSPYGNNVIDDYTFTGLRTKEEATPTVPGAYSVTDYGEVVLDLNYGQYYVYDFNQEDGNYYYYSTEDSSTPYRVVNPSSFDGFYRFVDTSSGIGIVGFKHSFTNLPGSENPTFSLKITTNETDSLIESDWREIASVEERVNVLFLNNVNRYSKFEIQFNTESDLSESLFLLLVQIQIEEISVPVISDHTRNVLSRFPGWTKIYGDSLEKATPEIAVPDTVAGSFFNSLIANGLDDIDSLMTRVDLDSYISSANTAQLSWIYLSAPVEAGFVKVTGNGIELARVSSYSELLQYTENDYVFYYNYLSSELFTIKEYTTLYTDSIKHEQIPIQSFNSFDELGMKVGLQRLFLEENDRFKQRIIDVYLNPPDVTPLGFKRTLRRELDIWKAYGSTPDSYAPGATPEIMEISDIVKNELYFNAEGNPKDSFYELVEELNKRFPSNYGYIKWGEAYWDYAGLANEGVSRIPQVADATPMATNEYQYGVGDFEDAKLVLEKLDSGINKYSFGLRAHGYKYDTTVANYEPIRTAYDTYVSYTEDYYDHEEATITYDVYLKLAQHGSIESNTVYKARKTKVLKNLNAPNSTSSPEYIVDNVFNLTGLTTSDYSFVSEDSSATPYRNIIEPSATESYFLTQIPMFAVQEATINYIDSKNSLGSTGDYAWVSFIDGTLATQSSPRVVKSFTSSTYADAQIKINSRIYTAPKKRLVNTPKVRNSGDYTIINSPTVGSSKSNIVFTPAEVLRNFSMPRGSTPQYVHIDNVPVDNVITFSDFSTGLSNFYGGVSLNKDLNENVSIGSSPNIYMSFINPNFATPHLHESYVDTQGSTVNYYFTNIKFPYASTPDLIFISSNDGANYPFMYPVWEEFNSDSINDYEFYLSDNGIVQASPNINQDLLDSQNSDVINWFDLTRVDFGLEDYAGLDSLYFTSIEALNENDNVEIWTDYTFNSEEKVINTDNLNDNTSLNYFDTEEEVYKVNKLPIRAKYKTDATKYISPSIRSGWYYQDEHRFVYAKPKTEVNSNNQEIILDQLARKGSPVLVSTIDSSGSTVNYSQVAFHEEATPSLYSHYNYEYITSTNGYSLYLAYENVFDVTVVDTYTGETIISGESFSSNAINFFSTMQTTPLTIGREYKATYRVLQTFNVDNQYFNEDDNSYRTKVSLLSTPNANYNTYVTYESSFYDDDFELPEVKLNPLYSALDEGFVYLSHNEYDYDTFDYILSPKQTLADGKDFMVLNIFSKDVNGNPKPYIDFNISGQNISATPNLISTNVEGYGSGIVRYSGANIPYEEVNYLYIEDPDNQTATVQYMVKPDYYGPNRITAEVDKKIITADSVQYLNIIGKTNPNVDVFWRKSRNLADLFDTPYSLNTSSPGDSRTAGKTVSESSGRFTIGPFISQPDATPGYWFASVETEFQLGSSSTPSTTAGDIVYWYEKYDSLQSTLDEPVFAPNNNLNQSKGHYADNKAIKVNSLTEKAYYNASATPTWTLPNWYPISKYTQYQMGLLGATPYVIEYSDTYPDYEEE
jgi:hypothetical protein